MIPYCLTSFFLLLDIVLPLLFRTEVHGDTSTSDCQGVEVGRYQKPFTEVRGSYCWRRV